ncbi:MAG: nitroreductase family protein [Candidatus Thorarchaeota archaeon]
MEKATRWASNALDAVGAPYMETGAAAQNLMLMATTMNLGTVLMQNFDPWHCAQHLKLPLRHALICAVLIGHKAASFSEANE